MDGRDKQPPQFPKGMDRRRPAAGRMFKIMQARHRFFQEQRATEAAARLNGEPTDKRETE